MSFREEEIIRMYKVRRTVMQMLNDRGYSVSDDELNMTQSQFEELYGENLNKDNLFITKEMRNNSSDKVNVYFLLSDPTKKTIGVAQVKTYFEKMISESVSKAILVIGMKLSPYAKAAFAEHPRFTIEVFEEAELVVNVMKHELVPEHHVLTDEEKKELLEKYRVQDTQLPRMLASDPVAKHFGLRRGKVVKIIRPSENVGKYVTYRLVF